MIILIVLCAVVFHFATNYMIMHRESLGREITMHLNQIITISADVLTQEVSGEMVLLDLNSEQYLGLNEVGARIWQLLEDNKDLMIVFEKLREEYDVDASLLENDLIQLIADMQGAGIVAVEEKKV